MSTRKPQRALISVYDKTGLVDFARALVDEFGIEIISTGGTAKLLTEAKIPVTLVEEVTGSPELLGGRVKTLHPKIHAAILADRDNPEHMRQLDEQGIKPIDMVVVNLYPFEKTVADPNCTFEQAIEMIDIGGVTLLRAAAKNHKHVIVVPWSDGYYDLILGRLRSTVTGGEPCGLKEDSFNAFWATCSYDSIVASWLSRSDDDESPDFHAVRMWRTQHLRYGENPHQSADHLLIYDTEEWRHDLAVGSLDSLSFNNCVDASAALELCAELTLAFGAGKRRPEIGSQEARHGAVWHRFSTGEQCGTGFQPVKLDNPSSSLQRVDDERHTRRNLPHIQTPGKTYFVTFRVKGDQKLSPNERQIVLQACRFWDGKKIHLHACVIMPDHVHLLFAPQEVKGGQWVSLSEILHSIKRYSAREINKLRGRTGPLWLDECFDRIVRNEREFCEKADYIADNPIKEGLVDAEPYEWWWDEEAHRLGIGAESENRQQHKHRLKTGATQEGATQEGATQEGATQERGAQGLSYCCTFTKHTNACGVGVGADRVGAYRRAYLGDPNAAMGGILACDFNVQSEFAEAVMNTYTRWGKEAGSRGFFVEVWIAPSFDEAALQLIRSSKNWGKRVQLLDARNLLEAPASPNELQYRSVAGGMLVQTPDVVGLNEGDWKVATTREPTDAEMDDLRLAWLVCKHTKSNAISICKDGMLIGNGAGQASRVMSCRIATWLANDNGHADQLAGAVAASDAFFPFRDGPDLLVDAGVTAIIQPGGSKRDQDVIDACNERAVAMVLTGTRHFKH
ncbi:MAG: transposase [Planctomycetes bacterium]|nr:transposase [Planctomycetota bacterium]